MMQLLKYWRKLSSYLNPIKSSFIVGCGHSGTSLLIRILGEHSHIYAIPEETRIFLKGKKLRYIAKQLKLFDQLAKTDGKKMWVEKTPKHVYHIEEILNLRPNTKIIALVRDPRDVACSIRDRGYTFEEGILRWINDNTEILKHRKNLYIVKLEDLIMDPQQNIQRVLNFLQLPYEDLLNYHMHPRDWYAQKVVRRKPVNVSGLKNHRMLRNWQINQPIFKTAQRYITEMSQEDQKIFNQNLKEIKTIAKSLGYFLP